MDDINLIERLAADAGRLRIFSLHLDFPAAIRARWAASTITRLAGERWSCSSELWKLESLQTAASVRKMITAEATQADVIILAVSSLNQKELELMQWLGSLAPVAAGPQPSRLLIGLFGDETQQARELDWTVKRCMSCARLTNRDFIWHWMEESIPGEPEWLTSHIETHLARKLSAVDSHCFLEPAVEFS
jgi:hypothetical protein